MKKKQHDGSILDPTNCVALNQKGEYTYYLLSEILKNQSCSWFSIEPIAEESFEDGKTVIEIRYGIFISSNTQDKTVPSRIFIKPASKIDIDKDEATYLWRTMADDLVLRYDKHSNVPVWVAMKKGSTTIWLP